MSIKAARDIADLQEAVQELRTELQSLREQVEEIETAVAHMNTPPEQSQDESKRKNGRANR